MKRITTLLSLALILALLAGCNNASGVRGETAPTPVPDLAVDISAEAGTLGALAAAMSLELGFTVSAGPDADQPANGIGAAKLAVSALGLDTLLRMENMSAPPSEEDYLRIALEHEVAPGTLFTSQGMNRLQIEAFAKAVAQAYQGGIGFANMAFEGTDGVLDAKAAMAVRLAVSAYNPLAEGRAPFYYGEGSYGAIAYWALAALGGMKGDEQIDQSLLEAVLIDPRADVRLGSVSVEQEAFAELLRQTMGIVVGDTTEGITHLDGRLYMSRQPGDPVRQFAYPYKVIDCGDYLRVYVDVLNLTLPAQYAGKAIVTLRKCPEAVWGYQVAAMERDEQYIAPAFKQVSAPITASGFYALSLIDGNYKTVWQIGKAQGEEARLIFTFSEPTAITGLAVFNGDHSGNQAHLEGQGMAGIVGVRFSEDAEADDMRFDLSYNVADVMAGRETVIPFSKEVLTDTVVIVFYGYPDKLIRISEVRPF